MKLILLGIEKSKSNSEPCTEVIAAVELSIIEERTFNIDIGYLHVQP